MIPSNAPRAVLIEELARVAFEYNAAARRRMGLFAGTWEKQDEATQAHYFGMVTAMVGVAGPGFFGVRSILHSTRFMRVTAWWRGFKERNIVGDEPHPDVSPFRHLLRKEGTPASRN